MLEKYFIEHCSPTLASIKCANLFSCSYTSEQQFDEQLSQWNVHFMPKGIQLFVLRKRNGTALVYMYRPVQLAKDLCKPETAAFLGQYGYTDMNIDAVINRLAARVQLTDSFPHEIGVMLGYPLADVIGFIIHKGENCKLSGTWKVYGDEHTAARTFARLKKCKAVYKNLYSKGKSVLRLTVAA